MKYWEYLDFLEIDGHNVTNFIKSCDKLRIDRGVPKDKFQKILESWIYELSVQLEENFFYGAARYLWASCEMDNDDPWLIKKYGKIEPVNKSFKRN
ncbi:MAG: hypothetical protein V3V31_16250 [Methylococcales bacterium]